MDICHLKNAELEHQFRKYKSREEDDSGAWLNRAHLRLNWQQQKQWDVIARLPDCDGQAADAISAYTQVKMEDAPKLFRSP